MMRAAPIGKGLPLFDGPPPPVWDLGVSVTRMHDNQTRTKSFRIASGAKAAAREQFRSSVAEFVKNLCHSTADSLYKVPS